MTVAIHELVTTKITATRDSLTVGPPICNFCGKEAWSIPNGPPHSCEGQRRFLHQRNVAAAVRLLEADGYTVKPHA